MIQQQEQALLAEFRKMADAQDRDFILRLVRQFVVEQPPMRPSLRLITTSKQ